MEVDQLRSTSALAWHIFKFIKMTALTLIRNIHQKNQTFDKDWIFVLVRVLLPSSCRSKSSLYKYIMLRLYIAAVDGNIEAYRIIFYLAFCKLVGMTWVKAKESRFWSPNLTTFSFSSPTNQRRLRCWTKEPSNNTKNIWLGFNNCVRSVTHNIHGIFSAIPWCRLFMSRV